MLFRNLHHLRIRVQTLRRALRVISQRQFPIRPSSVSTPRSPIKLIHEKSLLLLDLFLIQFFKQLILRQKHVLILPPILTLVNLQPLGCHKSFIGRSSSDKRCLGGAEELVGWKQFVLADVMELGDDVVFVEFVELNRQVLVGFGSETEGFLLQLVADGRGAWEGFEDERLRWCKIIILCLFAREIRIRWFDVGVRREVLLNIKLVRVIVCRNWCVWKGTCRLVNNFLIYAWIYLLLFITSTFDELIILSHKTNKLIFTIKLFSSECGIDYRTEQFYFVNLFIHLLHSIEK